MAESKGKGRRRFGRVRQLASGRWQARYPGPDGVDRPAPNTFRTKTEAMGWLTKKEAELLVGDWTDPTAGAIEFGVFADTWISERPNLRPNTVNIYRYLLRRHLLPTFGTSAVSEITDAQVRRWRKDRLDAGVSEVTSAKAYRLLKAVLNTALEDGMIRRNPCRLRGAGQESSAERPVLKVKQVFAMADAVGLRYRLLVLLAAFCGLRWGELAGLRRNRIELIMSSEEDDAEVVGAVIQVKEQLLELSNGKVVTGPPKSRAGNRRVIVPAIVLPDLLEHLRWSSNPEADGYVFATADAKPLRRSNFGAKWRAARAEIGLQDIHFHDLRHTSNTWAAEAGATMAELKQRLGHDSDRAASIYLHGSEERQHTLADALSERARRELRRRDGGGTPGPTGSGT
jgi:integrase